MGSLWIDWRVRLSKALERDTVLLKWAFVVSCFSQDSTESIWDPRTCYQSPPIPWDKEVLLSACCPRLGWREILNQETPLYLILFGYDIGIGTMVSRPFSPNFQPIHWLDLIGVLPKHSSIYPWHVHIRWYMSIYHLQMPIYRFAFFRDRGRKFLLAARKPWKAAFQRWKWACRSWA